MKLKRLIALTVVMAVIMSCFCAVATTVSADDGVSWVTYDGFLYKSGGTSYYALDKYFSNDGTDPSEDIAAEKLKGIYPKSGSQLSSCQIYLSSRGNGIGAIRSVEDEDAERGTVYEVLNYPELRSDLKNTGVYAGVSPTKDYPVFLFEYYFKIPKGDSQNIDKKQRMLLHSFIPGSSNDKGKAYITFEYSGANKTLSVTIAHLTPTKLWGNDTITVIPDKWYKVQARVWVNESKKVVVGIYYDDEPVSCYEQEKATNWAIDDYNMGVHQVYFTGADTYTSPGLVYYDDIHYGIYPVSYKPVAEEITLSADADKGDATATIKGYKDITDARLVAALYNGDTFAGVASSDAISGENGIRTITCNFPTGVNYTKYKLFLFDDYGTLKPLTPMVEKPIN